MRGGKQLKETLAILPLGGKHVGGYLLDKISSSNNGFGSTTAEQSIIRDLKEKKAKVAINNEKIPKSFSETYELPDGQILQLGSELYESSGNTCF